MLELERISKRDSRYQELRDRHYVPNRDTIGRQLHYLIWFDGQVSGIISGASAAYGVAPRDQFFGLVTHNNGQDRGYQLLHLVNNTVFRLENNIPNLATQVLAQWRRRVINDWPTCSPASTHRPPVLGFETFVGVAEHRVGTIYKADNWHCLGLTQGVAKRQRGGDLRKSTALIEREPTDRKLIFVKWAGKKRLLPTAPSFQLSMQLIAS